MRSLLAGLVVAFGMTGMADLALASIYAHGRVYVPGQVRDGVYFRPHFVSTPQLDYKAWPADPGLIPPKLDNLPPGPGPGLRADPEKLGEPS